MDVEDNERERGVDTSYQARSARQVTRINNSYKPISFLLKQSKLSG